MVYLLVEIESGNTPACCKALRRIVSDSGEIKLSGTTISEKEGLVEYKAGKSVIDNKKHKIVTQIEEKLYDDGKEFKLFIWGVKDNGKILGLDKKRMARDFYDKNEDKKKEEFISKTKNLSPDSEWIGDLKRKIESKEIVESAKLFRVTWKETLLLISIIKKNMEIYDSKYKNGQQELR